MRPAIVLFLTVVALAACSMPNPGLRPRRGTTTASPGVEWADLTFRTDVELYAQRWRPTAAPPKAVVVIHHGLADHSTRYEELARHLVASGYAVWSFDMRGHGRSAGPRITFDSIDSALNDLHAFMHLVRTNEPGLPLFLYGHSLGGLISCLYTIERQPQLAGLVLLAPALGFDAPALQAAAVAVLGVIAPGLPAIAPQHEDFSRRRDVVASMNADPWIHQGKGSTRSARSILDGVERVWKAAGRLVVPLLVEHGTADKVTAPASSREVVRRASSVDRTLRLHAGLYHDLLREPDGAGDRVVAEIVAWLDAHVAGNTAGLRSSTAVGGLAGDAKGRMFALELDGRAELDRADKAAATASGGLRLRAGFGRRAAYFAGLDARVGSHGGAYYEIDAHVLGAAIRGSSGALASLSAGIGIGGVRQGTAHLPFQLGLEAPVGPVRLVARGALSWHLRGAGTEAKPPLADELSGLVGVRFGRDRRYWGTAVAGGGPLLAITYRHLGGDELLGVSLGLALWGGD